MDNDTEPYSDSESEFGEGRRKPIVSADLDTKLVVAAADILDEGVPCADHSGGAQLFEAAHRPQSSFESSMICFDAVIAVLLGEVQAAGTSSSSTRG
jgi:hypothetical protein